MISRPVTSRLRALLALISVLFLCSTCREQAPDPSEQSAAAPAPNERHGSDTDAATSPSPPPDETAPPVVVDAWRRINSAQPDALPSLIDHLAAMTDEGRAQARRAAYRVTDAAGSRLGLAGESFDFPYLHKWGRELIEVISPLPAERQMRVLESLDAVFYGIMRSRDSLVESWRISQRAKHGDDIVDDTGDVLGSSPAEWLIGTPDAYTHAALWRSWIATRLSELTDDPDLAAAHAARSRTLHSLARSGRYHEGDSPP